MLAAPFGKVVCWAWISGAWGKMRSKYRVVEDRVAARAFREA